MGVVRVSVILLRACLLRRAVLAAIIHRFHKLAREVSEDDEVYQQAKAEYVRAVQALRGRDEDWLADLMLSLDALLGDLQDESGKSESHVDEFLENVRSALVHLRRDIHMIHAEQQAKSAARRRAQP